MIDARDLTEEDLRAIVHELHYTRNLVNYDPRRHTSCRYSADARGNVDRRLRTILSILDAET